MQILFQRRGVQAGCLAIAVLAAVIVLTTFVDRSPRGSLPSTAKDIHEFRSPGMGITGDYWYLLKAKVTDEEFLWFVKRMQLTPLDQNNPRQKAYHWNGYGTQEWWLPLETLQGTYHDPTASGSSIRLAKHESGYLYYLQSHGL